MRGISEIAEFFCDSDEKILSSCTLFLLILILSSYHIINVDF